MFLKLLVVRNCFILSSLFVLMANMTFGIWSPKSTIPSSQGRTASMSFVLKDRIYVVGGYNSSSTPMNQNWQYNPINDSWTQKASYPLSSIVSGNTFVINDLGYVVTGKASTGNTTKVYAYEPNLNLWFPKNDFSGFARYTGSSFEINGVGYFGCGYNPLTNDIWSYDSNTDSWTQVSSLPSSARQSAVSFSLNGKGYLGLGSLTNHPQYTSLTDFWEYKPTFNSWTQKASYPGAGRWACTVYTVGNEGYVGCGISYTLNVGPYTHYDDIWKYDPQSDSWSFSNTFPSARSATVTAVVNGVVYSGFGQNSTGILSDWWADSSLVSTGLKPKNLDCKITVAPNPVVNDLILNIKDYNVGISTGQVRILNIEGKLVSKVDVDYNLNPRVDVRRLSSGTYLCQLLNNKGQLIGSKKFVKE